MKKLLQWKWYLAAATLYMLAAILRLEPVKELLRLSFIPLAFAYYTSRHQTINKWVWLLLVSYYVGDVLRSMHNVELMPFTLGAYSVGHVSFMYISYRCIRDLKVKRLLFSAIPFIVLWLIYFNYSIKDIFGSQMGENYTFVLMYSILLSAFLIIALIKFFNDEQKVYLFTVIIALCFVGCDIMLGLYQYVAPARIFEISYALGSAAGHFFLLRFVDEFDFKQI